MEKTSKASERPLSSSSKVNNYYAMPMLPEDDSIDRPLTDFLTSSPTGSVSTISNDSLLEESQEDISYMQHDILEDDIVHGLCQYIFPPDGENVETDMYIPEKRVDLYSSETGSEKVPSPEAVVPTFLPVDQEDPQSENPFVQKAEDKQYREEKAVPRQCNNVKRKPKPRNVRKITGRVKSPRKTPGKRANRTIHLWEFLRELLNSGTTSNIQWISKKDGIFRLVNSSAVAKMWGERKNRHNMTYEKMSRALRYYYEKEILERVPNARLIYKFGQRTRSSVLETAEESLSDSSEN